MLKTVYLAHSFYNTTFAIINSDLIHVFLSELLHLSAVVDLKLVLAVMLYFIALVLQNISHLDSKIGNQVDNTETLYTSVKTESKFLLKINNEILWKSVCVCPLTSCS